MKYQYITEPNVQAISDFLKHNSVREVIKE